MEPIKYSGDEQDKTEEPILKEGVIISMDKEKGLVTLSNSTKQMSYSTTDRQIKRLYDKALLSFNDLQISQKNEITGADIIVHPMHFMVKIERLIDSNTLEFAMKILAVEDRVATQAMKNLKEFSKIPLLPY